MAVYWTNVATSNRFGNKHLYIVSGQESLTSLVDEGFAVFDDRVRANYLANKNRKTSDEWDEKNYLHNKYGVTPVSKNTMIMLNSAGLAGLEADIIRAGRNASGWYGIKNGIIFDTNDNSYVASLVAEVKLDVRPCRGGVEVYHLASAVLLAPLKRKPGTSNSEVKIVALSSNPMNPSAPPSATLGMRFVPSIANLEAAKSHLRSPGG